MSVTNGVVASSLTGTLQTASQPNITAIGNLSTVSIAGHTIGGEAVFLSGAVEGTAVNSKVLVLSSSGSIGGIDSISATNIFGSIETASQPNITSIGTLSSLNVTNGVVASSLTGTLQTASQPNITSIGNLSTISIAGHTVGSEAGFLSGASAGSAVNGKVLVLSSIGAINNIASLTATDLYGTIRTASQPNITSIGSLTSLTIAGSIIGNEATYLSGATPGTASNSKVLVLNSSGAIGGITSLSATDIFGSLKTASQPLITSIGTLSSLSVDGNVIISSASEATDSQNGGALTISGGIAVAKKAFIGGNTTINGEVSVNNSSEAFTTTSGCLVASGGVGIAKSLRVGNGIYGTIETGSQPHISSVGVLSGLSIGEQSAGYPLYVSGSFSPETPTSYVSLNSSGAIYESSTAPVSVSIACSGRILCNGEIDVASDYRIKENISIIENADADEFIDNIVPVRFNYKTEPDRMNFGYIAQDVAKRNIKEIITESYDSSIEEHVDEDGFVSPAGTRFGVVTGNIIPLLHMKVKSLSTENKQLQKQLQILMDRVSQLEFKKYK